MVGSCPHPVLSCFGRLDDYPAYDLGAHYTCIRRI